jgi:hypothetical protein
MIFTLYSGKALRHGIKYRPPVLASSKTVSNVVQMQLNYCLSARRPFNNLLYIFSAVDLGSK